MVSCKMHTEIYTKKKYHKKMSECKKYLLVGSLKLIPLTQPHEVGLCTASDGSKSDKLRSLSGCVATSSWL
jgi:hypothetical protein